MKRFLTSATVAAITINIACALEISTVTSENRIVTVSTVSDNILRVTNAGYGEQVTALPLNSNATATVYHNGNTDIMITRTGLMATLNLETGSLIISGGNGKTIEDNGSRPVVDAKRLIEIPTTGNCSFYGTGERGQSFNLAGDTLVMYNRANYGYGKGDPRNSQMNINMPLVISSNGYALLFDDCAAAEMILNNPIKYITESRNPITYYFINGTGTLADVTSTLTSLTGRQDLPPFWALGYITSKYGYKTEAETLATVDTLKRAGYPLDGIVLDLYWYGKEEDMGRLDWEPQQWADPTAMLANLKSQGVNLVAISQPFVLRNGKGIDNYNQLKDKDIFVKDSLGNVQDVTIWVGEGGMFDVSSPAARQWLTERYRSLTDQGITGWWGDLGEPEVHPTSAVHSNGLTAREYHNYYGNDWASIIYNLYKNDYPDTRLFTLMRAGTTGLQRYSVFPWSSDVARTWGGLQAQIPIMLNSSLSGLGYMSHDIGGFAVDENLISDPEMYVRWMQLGLFTPILRTHAQKMAEPYKYTGQQPILLDIVKQRYRWLPYNYTLAYENASQGLPLVRPLNFYSSQSSRYDDIEDQYLWGKDVMIAPVIEPGVKSRRVVIPEGKWYDFNNPRQLYSEGDTIDYPTPLDVIPVMVRAGAFLPFADYPMDNTGDYRTSVYTVQYYPAPGVESNYSLFEDDRQSTTSLASNNYALVNFRGNDSGDTITISIDVEGQYNPLPKRTVNLVINNITESPESVTVNGKKARSKFDRTAATLAVTVILTKNGGPTTVTVIR